MQTFSEYEVKRVVNGWQVTSLVKSQPEEVVFVDNPDSKLDMLINFLDWIRKTSADPTALDDVTQKLEDFRTFVYSEGARYAERTRLGGGWQKGTVQEGT